MKEDAAAGLVDEKDLNLALEDTMVFLKETQKELYKKINTIKNKNQNHNFQCTIKIIQASRPYNMHTIVANLCNKNNIPITSLIRLEKVAINKFILHFNNKEHAILFSTFEYDKDGLKISISANVGFKYAISNIPIHANKKSLIEDLKNIYNVNPISVHWPNDPLGLPSQTAYVCFPSITKELAIAHLTKMELYKPGAITTRHHHCEKCNLNRHNISCCPIDNKYKFSSPKKKITDKSPSRRDLAKPAQTPPPNPTKSTPKSKTKAINLNAKILSPKTPKDIKTNIKNLKNIITKAKSNTKILIDKETLGATMCIADPTKSKELLSTQKNLKNKSPQTHIMSFKYKSLKKQKASTLMVISLNHQKKIIQLLIKKFDAMEKNKNLNQLEKIISVIDSSIITELKKFVLITYD